MAALGAQRRAEGTNYGQSFAQARRQAEDQSMAKQTAIADALSTIRNAEAQRAPNPRTGVADPYNGLVTGRRGAPTHANLTDMTISEVQDYQRGMIARGHPTTAVGAYQTVAGTLAEQVARSNINPDTTRFTKAVQDELAVGLIDNRAAQARRNGEIAPERFHDRLASEWAALKGPTGRGRYDGDGLNKASVSSATVGGLARGLVDSGAIDGVTSRRGGAGAPSAVAQAATPDIGPTPTARATNPGRAGIPSPTSRPSMTAEAAPSFRSSQAMTPAASSFAAPTQSPAPAPTMRGTQTVLSDRQNTALTGRLDALSAPMGLSPNEPTRMASSVPAPAAPAYSPTIAPDRIKSGAPAAIADVTTPAVQPTRAPTPTTKPAQRFAETYLAKPAAQPKPAPRESVTQAPTQAPTRAAVPAERTIVDKAVAGAIDIGVGMIPGLGMPAAAYSLAAPMLGLPTAGDMALSLRDKNTFDPNEQAAKEAKRRETGRAGIGSGMKERATDPVIEDVPAMPPPPATEFAAKYLGFNDPTKRPTPEEKWGASGAPSSAPYRL
ncbi:hypothetical protein DYI37_03925 [Fulvimarina endophytica]|uniref:Uncharacterized protein n=1 Tax=Fulvimarina endophytica TaxID=2293836 RepID=A0A371X728_9HYPH|nr:hypothetical protein [Fulvimarina endophytica]RFC65023.1 hypothetical protein DYI37_03925 [Fulvimarina endophytica]